MTKDEVISKIHNIFIEGFEVEENLLNGKAQLGDDLGLDSLDGVDLVVAIEKEFGCQIPEDKAQSMMSLQEIYDYVGEYLEQVS